MNLKEPGYPGIILFILLLVVMILVSFVAVGITGEMGVEERFSSALGLAHDEVGDHEEEPEHGEGQGFFGFAIEGDIMGYIAVIMALLLVCGWLVMRRDRDGAQ